jgi:large-conductance mechanosensitive channel
VDDTPKAFLEEFRTSVLKKRVGQIALAVVLAEAVWRLVNSLTWYLIIPLIGRAFQGHAESVMFESATRHPMPLENLFGSMLEFLLTVITVFYLNRWIHRKPREATVEDIGTEYSLVGDSPALIESETRTDREQR